MDLAILRSRRSEAERWLRCTGRRLGRLLGRREGLRTAPVSELRCQRKPFSELQGFAGRPIDDFPPCLFFRAYLTVPDRARRDFAAWYEEWFLEREAWRVAKAEGGMGGGSLARTAAALHRRRHGSEPEDPGRIGPDLVRRAIELRVDHYLGLFESIQRRGFVPWLGPPIHVVSEGGRLYLENGHHRAAALRVLGIPALDVIVRPWR